MQQCDVTLGEKIQVAIDKVSRTYDKPVSVSENSSNDPALSDSVRIQLQEKQQNVPESVVDIFVDKKHDKVLAIGRTLDYARLGNVMFGFRYLDKVRFLCPIYS